MKKTLLIVGFMIAAVLAFSQSAKRKLSKEESTRMTQDQRFVHESNRKSKKDGRTSVKKKSKIQKKQSRKSERVRAPKRKKRTVKG